MSDVIGYLKSENQLVLEEGQSFKQIITKIIQPYPVSTAYPLVYVVLTIHYFQAPNNLFQNEFKQE